MKTISKVKSNSKNTKILILAAHPDDEVLGMGATIKKLSKKGCKIHLCVISEGASAQYSEKKMITVRRKACTDSGKILGISTFDFFDFPDMRLESIPQLEINQKLENIISKFKPDTVYTTPNNDLNKDHQKVFESALVVTRPLKSNVKNIISYELPGYTKNPFSPNLYENITKELNFKIKAFNKYESEVENFPHPRSIEAIENLAIQRGVESGFKKAESFQIIKSLNS